MADVAPSLGDAVWGALYRMREADWPTLDAYEVFDAAGPEGANEYVRRLVMVTLGNEPRAMEAWCYFVRAPREHVAPSEHYRAALIEGALERGLPADYVSQMRRAFEGGRK